MSEQEAFFAALNAFLTGLGYLGAGGIAFVVWGWTGVAVFRRIDPTDAFIRRYRYHGLDAGQQPRSMGRFWLLWPYHALRCWKVSAHVRR